MPFNEFAQWAVIVVFGLLILGLYRQLAVYLGVPSASSLNALVGPRLRRRLPDPALNRIREFLVPTSILAFVAEGCAGCHRLLSQLADASVLDEIAQGDRVGVVVVALDPSPPFLEALRGLKVPVVADHEGDIWRACNIQATPFLVITDEHGLVLSKEVNHDVRFAAEAWTGSRAS